MKTVVVCLLLLFLLLVPVHMVTVAEHSPAIEQSAVTLNHYILPDPDVRVEEPETTTTIHYLRRGVSRAEILLHLPRDSVR